MKIEITQATVDDKPVLRRMLEFSGYELSPFEDRDLNPHGEFGYPYLDHYWKEEGCHAFLVRVDGKLAGFAMVNTHHYTPDAQFSMAEFLIMRRFQRQGIGKAVAFEVFSRFQGTWEVHQLRKHAGAQQFWRTVVAEFTSADFHELDGCGEWDGPIQVFESKGQPTTAPTATNEPSAGGSI
jgi:predicted acetyltransferase